MDDLRPMLEEDKVEKGQDICTVRPGSDADLFMSRT